MQMKHALPRIRPHVEHGAISASQTSLLGQRRGLELQVPQYACFAASGRIQARNVLLRHQQDVRRRTRMDIFERQNVFILEHLPCGYLAGYDLAEKTVLHGGALAL